MKEERNIGFQKHIFICETCTYGNQTQGEERDRVKNMRKDMKAYFKEKYPFADIRINGSSCLGKCVDGVNCVVFPENLWLQKVNPNDPRDLIRFLEENYFSQSASE